MPPAALGSQKLHEQAQRSQRHLWRPQITKQLERELLNHRSLLHLHVLQFKEVRRRCDHHQFEPVSVLAG